MGDWLKTDVTPDLSALGVHMAAAHSNLGLMVSYPQPRTIAFDNGRQQLWRPEEAVFKARKELMSCADDI